MSYVSIRALAKSFGTAPVFRDIDLDIGRGEMCVLVGPSGCGKTTLLRAIAGLAAPDAGTIAIDGVDVTRARPRERGVGMVFQHYALFPNMTVEQNLAFGLEQMRLAPAEIRRRVGAMIDTMELGPRRAARPAALSGGQKQRVALARALVLEPKLMLLDEPMSALDAQIRKRLREELKRLQRAVGFTAVFVTHDQEEALLLGDRIAVMQSGRLAQVGGPAEIYDRPASRAVATFIGDFNLLEPADVEAVFGRRPAGAWAIHPEAIEFAAPGETDDAGRWVAPVRIEECHVLGPVLRYGLAAGAVKLKMTALNRPGAPRVAAGGEARIRVAAADIREFA